MVKTTRYYFFAYTVFLLLSCQMLCLAISLNPDLSLVTDQFSLLAFKAHITSDPYGIVTSNWTNSSSVCSWIGVTCGSRHQRVIALNISNMVLTGTIPPQIGNLSFLVSLDLRFNLFSGTLPEELSRLHRLKILALRNNSFTGFVPKSMSNLTNLERLDFSFNSLMGSIPNEFGLLYNLQVLSMQYNRLSGAIPSAIFNLSNLEVIAFTSNELSGSLPFDLCTNLPFLKGIYLYENQLSGQIPANLSQCSQLQMLSLSYNYFNGPIPKEIGMLESLQNLYLGGNNLNGPIPQEIGNLQNLVVLAIERNYQITGYVPLNIFNISSLEHLLLFDNKLIGSLPREIGNLTMLLRFSISTNNFKGILPREIGKLYQLEELNLGINRFTGLIPPQLYNISTLRFLYLNGNDLSGSLPNNFGYKLPLLERLSLSQNNFSGPIPKSISNCFKLRLISLTLNKFTGFIPHFLGNLRLLEILELQGNDFRREPSSSELSFITSLTNCRSLKSLDISENPLDGTIPASIGNFSISLESFFISNCGIKGTIPNEIGNLSNLLKLGLSDNELSGNIPLTIRHLHSLQLLDLENNNLRGPILQTLCDLPRLHAIFLSRNQFSGQIPECLGNFTSLRVLYLNSNMLSSSIPQSLWQLKDLLVLDLSSNSLSGFLPAEIGNLVSAIYINLSMNQLSEYIPSTVGNLQSLLNFSLAKNALKGSIPMSMGNMISLINLDLSYNNFSGSIPKSMEKLQHLKSFNVSFNALSGEIPTSGPFKNLTMQSFEGNGALCGVQTFNVSPCRIVSKHSSRRNKTHFALFILSGVLAFIMVLFFALMFIRYRRKNKAITSGIDVLISTAPERISYYELLQATEQFSETNLLGKGSFGSVYRGTFRDGKILAVKVFNLQSQDGFKSFEVECKVLRNIRHRNLTKVVSSCSNEDFKALVLEYMPNGSLEKWLYSHNYFLDLMQRLNIMIHVASAMEYLHHGYSTPIVHCDLKPSNILLDEDMTAHVSDFGIAKLLGEDESIKHTNTLATLGYIAPEYGLEGLVSIRCDVFSFGIMLMETFTRKRPSDDMFTGDLSLKSWIESLHSRSSVEVIDTNLLNYEEDGSGKKLDCVSSILKLALKCSTESPGERLNMKEAVAELLKIKHQFLA